MTAMCRKGHALTPDNVYTRAGGHRRCKECHRRWAREYRPRRTQCTQLHGQWAYRRSEIGVVLARGPLDYDVPVRVRCQSCGGVFERPLDAIGDACPHCRRYPEAVA